MIEDPIPSAIPPQLPEYHFHTALNPGLPPLSLNVTASPGHIVVEGLAIKVVGEIE